LGAVADYSPRAPVVETERVEVAVPAERTVVVEKIVERPVEKPVEVVKEVVVERPVEKTVERAVYREAEAEPRALEVTAARDVECWSVESRSWRPLAPDVRLTAATVLRGTSGGARLESGTRAYRLGTETFVVTDDAIEPLPPPVPPPLAVPGLDADLHELAARPGYALGTRVSRLLGAWGTGSAGERSLAQSELTKLWRELGDPPRDLLERFARPLERDQGPPQTLEEWERWWKRVREQKLPSA
jgi:hypothetical protein